MKRCFDSIGRLRGTVEVLHTRTPPFGLKWAGVCILWLPALAVPASQAVFAQQVSGIARVGSSTVPSEQTSVALVDTAGTIVSATLTSGDGRYTLTARAAGRFRVRARRIGFTPDSSNFLNLAADERVTFDPRLNVLATIRLPAVAVSETRRCVISPDAGTAAFRLWQEAQAALAGSVAGPAHGQMQFLLGRFEREVDLETGTIMRSREWEIVARGETYLSVPAESLATHGFAHVEGDHSVYYAPDGRTLTSETFARTHCLRPVVDPRRPELVGLGFQPVHAPASTGRTDVSGVLWLDRATAQLRFLEYQYTGEGSGASSGADGSGWASGRVDYRLLPSGTWIVNDWLVRVPVVTRVAESEVHAAGGYYVTHTRTVGHVISRWEMGGDVKEIRDPDALVTRSIDTLAAVHGQVVASDHNAVSLRDLTVLLAPESRSIAGIHTSRTAQVDANGRFRFDSVPSGNYLLNARSLRLDTLYIRVPDTHLALESGVIVTAQIVIPPEVDALGNACGRFASSSASASVRVVHGLVRDNSSAAPIRNATVRASWLQNAMITGAGASMSFVSSDRTTLTDSLGRYVLCDLPVGKSITIRASTNNLRSLPLGIQADTTPVLMRDIAIPRAEHSGRERAAESASGTNSMRSGRAAGVIDGTVLDSAGRGLSDVQVSLLEPDGKSTHTTSSGGYRLVGVAAGSHVLRFRRVGLRPISMRIDVNADSVVEADAVMSVASQALATVVVRGARVDTLALPPGIGARIANGMGTYITARDIERQKPSRTSDLFRGVAGFELSNTGTVGNSRGIISIYSEGCKGGAPIYLDGALLGRDDKGSAGASFSASGLVDMVNPADIAAIEIYRGGADLPSGTPRNACGGVFIWTRR